MGCFAVAEFLLTSASRSPSAIAEPLVSIACRNSVAIPFFLDKFAHKTSTIHTRRTIWYDIEYYCAEKSCWKSNRLNIALSLQKRGRLIWRKLLVNWYRPSSEVMVLSVESVNSYHGLEGSLGLEVDAEEGNTSYFRCIYYVVLRSSV